jgi:uncharacterized membrane protein YidH (DUF202 family)
MTGAPTREDNGAAQFERTVLAWNRASIAVAANGALLIRTGIIDHLGVLDGAGLAVVAIGVVLWVVSMTRYSALPGQRATHLIAGQPRAVLSLAGFVLLLSLIDLAVVGLAR